MKVRLFKYLAQRSGIVFEVLEFEIDTLFFDFDTGMILIRICQHLDAVPHDSMSFVDQCVHILIAHARKPTVNYRAASVL